jgi:hypothetical protein
MQMRKRERNRNSKTGKPTNEGTPGFGSFQPGKASRQEDGGNHAERSAEDGTQKKAALSRGVAHDGTDNRAEPGGQPAENKC